jgi:hypothetical protein
MERVPRPRLLQATIQLIGRTAAKRPDWAVHTRSPADSTSTPVSRPEEPARAVPKGRLGDHAARREAQARSSCLLGRRVRHLQIRPSADRDNRERVAARCAETRQLVASAFISGSRQGDDRVATNAMASVRRRWRALSFSQELSGGLSFGDVRLVPVVVEPAIVSASTARLQLASGRCICGSSRC